MNVTIVGGMVEQAASLAHAIAPEHNLAELPIEAIRGLGRMAALQPWVTTTDGNLGRKDRRVIVRNTDVVVELRTTFDEPSPQAYQKVQRLMGSLYYEGHAALIDLTETASEACLEHFNDRIEYIRSYGY